MISKEKLKQYKDLGYPILYKIAVNDANYKTRLVQNYINSDGKRTNKDVWVCPYFSKWKNMLSRCYGKSSHKCYGKVSVCDSWLLFSNFKSWMEKQPWEGNSLDKDLLVLGNTVYSPDTCIFLPKHVNSFMIDQKKQQYTGTSYHKYVGKWQANVSNPFTNKLENLGYYSSQKDAYNVWLERKRVLAKKLAQTLGEEYKLVKDLLINRY